jgi:hypothetical protein
MLIQIRNVSVENVVKGKSRYSVAHVTYDFQGAEKTRKIMSFSNPDVFKKVQEAVGQSVEVVIGKNDAGYDEWKSVTITGSASTTGTVSSPPTANRVSGSNYENKEERAARQVLIVKQSSLSAAVATLTPGAKAALDPRVVLDLAQQYVDWVFEQQEEDELDVLN